MYRNGYGYPDPTAFAALSNIRREEKKAERERRGKTNGKRRRRKMDGQKMESMGERGIQPFRPGV